MVFLNLKWCTVTLPTINKYTMCYCFMFYVVLSVKGLHMQISCSYTLVQCIEWWHLCFNCTWSLLNKVNNNNNICIKNPPSHEEEEEEEEPRHCWRCTSPPSIFKSNFFIIGFLVVGKHLDQSSLQVRIHISKQSDRKKTQTYLKWLNEVPNKRSQ